MTTSSPGRLPDFAVIGAAKAGTTALHSYLEQHPALAMSRPKETFFFVREEIERCTGVGAGYAPRPLPRDLADYATRFPPDREACLRGESCVAYLYFPDAPRRLRAANAACKLVALLRDPADRAFSNYLHHVRDCIEPLDFRRALKAGPARVRSGWWFGFDYVGGGAYATQLRRVWEQFPPDQTLVVWYDEFRRDAPGTCRRLFSFLGVEREVLLDTRAELNVSLVVHPRFRLVAALMDRLETPLRRSIGRRRQKRLDARVRNAISHRPVLSDEDRVLVYRALRGEIDALEKATGRDLAAWRRD